jgi:4-hydroxy-3-methylbut-2-enyl diphosphate reductase IspH
VFRRPRHHALAVRQAATEPLTVLGDLVHNETVLAELSSRGVKIAQQVAAVETRTVTITVHGASDRARVRARGRGLDVIEATCPLVRLAHRAVLKLARDGYHPVIVGKTVEGFPFGARCENALISYGRYLGKLFWPTDLGVFYTPGIGRCGMCCWRGL